VAITLYDEVLHEAMSRSWGQDLPRKYLERVRLCGRTRTGKMNGQRGRGVDLRMDVVGRRMDIDADDGEDGGYQDELDWTVSVANEGRIEGEVETGNADLPGHILHHHYYYHHYW